MKVAVLSGKGGTGKTFLSVNLAASCPHAVYADCDVEEPNGRLFFAPYGENPSTVSSKVPAFDPVLCTGCRRCVDFCRFHALVFLRNQPKVFTDICHSCGGCALVCPAGAVREEERPVGQLLVGKSRDTTVITGILDLGEASAVPVIQAVLHAVPPDGETVLIDCPPGSSCSVTESVCGADFCLIVAEATAFGFHNFRMVYELCRILGKPCGVVINKYVGEYPPLTDFCRANGVEILMKIPYDAQIAQAVSAGQILSRISDRWCGVFRAIMERIRSGNGGRNP